MPWVGGSAMGETFILDFRVQDVGGPVVRPQLYRAADGGLVPAAEVGPTLRAYASWAFLIHGFANDRTEGRTKLGAFATQLRLEAALEPCFLLVLWPGDNLLSPLSYSVEEVDARSTADKLAAFILQHLSPAARPHFLAHSLGCLVALETMKRLQDQGLSAGQCILLAGAVDCDALARGTRFRACTQAAARLQVLSSKKDRVLQWCFPIGDLLAGLFFGGYTRSALGRVGPRPSPSREAVPGTVATLALQDAWQVGHGDYLAESDGRMNAKHLSSAHLAAGVLSGGPAVYPPP